MEPLKITAVMGSAIACYDSWSPSLDSLLEWLILDKLNLTSPNPTPEQVEATRPIVDREMPLAKGELMGEWYWQVSSPCYRIVSEYTDRFRKRWQPGIDSPEPAWGKRKAKWSTSVYIVHAQFTVLLGFYEQLMTLGFSKTEIDTGDYRSDRLMQNLEIWEPLEEAIAQMRGTRLLQLISFVGQIQ